MWLRSCYRNISFSVSLQVQCSSFQPSTGRESLVPAHSRAGWPRSDLASWFTWSFWTGSFFFPFVEAGETEFPTHYLRWTRKKTEMRHVPRGRLSWEYVAGFRHQMASACHPAAHSTERKRTAQMPPMWVYLLHISGGVFPSAFLNHIFSSYLLLELTLIYSYCRYLLKPPCHAGRL